MLSSETMDLSSDVEDREDTDDAEDREEPSKMVECRLSVQCEDTELHGRGRQSVAC